MTVFIYIYDASVKTVDGSQGVQQSGRPAKGNEVIGVAPVWGRPRRLRCLCQSRCIGIYEDNSV
jgi:hypothetical protein